MMSSLSCGGKLLIASIRILHLIFFAAMVGAAPPFGKVFYGVPRQQKWVVSGK
jgi:hypothetical protein